jgi:phage repressor protein C with HTH and peptisase S24 domain
VRDRLRDRNLSMQEVSIGIGKNHAYIQQYLERGKPISLPEDVREMLAPVLGVTPDELRDTAQVKVTATVPAPSTRIPAASADRIPVMGVGEGGSDGWQVWNGEVIEYVQRPPALLGATSAYAVYVVGHSMEPRYHPGELLFVNPAKPVTPGTYVLVQTKPVREGEPPRALVKRFVKRSGSKIVLAQYQPEKQIEIAADQIVSLHRVVGTGE